MNRLTTRLAPLLLIFTLTACGTNLGSIEVTEESAESTITGAGANPLGNVLPVDNLFPPMKLDINLEEELAQQDAGPAKAVYLTNLDMAITDTEQPEGDTDNFNFVDKVTVYVEPTKSDSKLEKKQIAILENVPEDQTVVTFETDDTVDLKPYVEEGMRLTTAGSGEVPEDDTSLKAIVTLTIKLL